MTVRLPALVQGRIFLAGVVVVVSFVTSGSLQATSIDLGSAPHITSQVASAYGALNGVSLTGQTLSLDFSFTRNEFVRLFSITDTSFVVLLTLQTNGSGLVGFLDGEGFLVDQQGNPLQPAQELGSASGHDGSMAAGLFPLLEGELPRPLDFFGVHFELTLPVHPSISIASGQFRLLSGDGHPFGIGPGLPPDIVPDVGSTAFFLTITLGALISIKARLTPA